MNTRRWFAWLSLAFCFALAACGGAPAPAAEPTTAPAAAPTTAAAAPAPTAAPASKTLKIVASTSWVAAFAKAAGATDITVIAPSNIQHPPDYDPKPSDLAAVSSADYVLLAGFEGFARRMQEAVGNDSAKLITVATDNSPEAIHKEVARLGQLFGTPDTAKAYLDDFDKQYAQLSGEVKTSIGAHKPVVVAQAFVTAWAAFAGLDVAGTYGPMPLGPDDLKKLADLKPTVVFENVHMGGGQPVIEASGARKIDLINFPADDLDLLKVFKANAQTIEQALGGDAAASPAMSTSAEATPFGVSVAQFYLDSAGFHGMAEVLSDTRAIDPTYAGTVSRVAKVLRQTAWPAELKEQGAAFVATLDSFGTALKDGKVEDAITTSAAAHDAQHELSHAIDAWLETKPAPATEAMPFDLSLAQFQLDSVGLHGMAEVLSDTKTIDPTSYGKVNRLAKLLRQVSWPAELKEQGAAFVATLGSFGTALKDGKVEDAISTSAAAHDAQHELSHAIDAWLDTRPAPAAATPFDLSVAQFQLDSAGLHGMASVLSDTKAIDPTYYGTVNRLAKLLRQVTWPAELKEQGAAFVATLGSFGTALKDGKVEDAITTSAAAHDAQHELSHAIGAWLGTNSH